MDFVAVDVAIAAAAAAAAGVGVSVLLAVLPAAGGVPAVLPEDLL